MRVSQLAPRLSTTYTRNSSLAAGASVGLSSHKVITGHIGSQVCLIEVQDGGGTWRTCQDSAGNDIDNTANVGVTGYAIAGSGKVRIRNTGAGASDTEWFWWKTS